MTGAVATKAFEELRIPESIIEVYEKATCIYNREQVEAAMDKMAEQMRAVVSSENPIFLAVVVGGMIPMGHLLMRLDFPLEVDYIHATRFRGETKGDALEWKALPTSNLKDRTVVVVDDILDSGITMGAVVNYCKEQGARKVFSATLVDKKGARKPEGLQTADFIGLEVENRYVFGYGLDYKEYLRNAPGIYIVAPEHQ